VGGFADVAYIFMLGGVDPVAIFDATQSGVSECNVDVSTMDEVSAGDVWLIAMHAVAGQ